VEGIHFIEIAYGKDGYVWIVIHSGSRGFGHKIASYYMTQAYLIKNGSNDNILQERVEDFKQRNRIFKEKNPEKFEKALEKFINKQKIEITKRSKPDNIKGIYPLDVNSKLGMDYIIDQNFALEFALENRKQMMQKVFEIITKTLKADKTIDFEDENRFINRNHNHAEFEESRGEWIHRKGCNPC